MLPFETRVPEDIVTRVGAAAGHVARIQQDYAEQVEWESSIDARNALASQARAAAERAIDERGLSIQDYNAVLSAAANDHDLERRLVEAAREVL